MDKNKTIIVIAVATFIIGLIVSYTIWGKKEEGKADVKQLLNQAIQGIETLEKENRNLRLDLEKAKKNKLKQENQTLKEQLEKAQQENEKLQKGISNLKDQVAHTELQLEAKEELRMAIENQSVRIAELEKENQDLKITLEKIVSVTKQQEVKIPEQLQEETIPEQPQEEIIKTPLD